MKVKKTEIYTAERWNGPTDKHPIAFEPIGDTYLVVVGGHSYASMKKGWWIVLNEEGAGEACSEEAFRKRYSEVREPAEARLLERAEEFLDHAVNCAIAYHPDYSPDPGAKCTCGLDQLKAEIAAAKKP